MIVIAIILASCGTKKKTVEPAPAIPEQTQPTWHTCLIRSAHAVVSRDGEKMSSAVTMQTVHDSLLVISVTPMLGIEMMRLEATPTTLIAIDKVHGQYAEATYAQINNKLTPSLNWDILQQACTATLPTGSDKARLAYTFGDEQIELIISYTDPIWDTPLRIQHMPLNKYTQIDITKWL